MARNERREPEPPHPIEPTFYGVEQEPWARYTGAAPWLRGLTAWIARRKHGGSPIRTGELLVVLAVGAVVFGLLGIAMWIVQSATRP
jgi:hypothetical protein